MNEISRLQFLSVATAAAFASPLTALFAGRSAAPMVGKIPVSGEAVPRVGLGTYATFDVGAGSAQAQQVKEVLAEFYRLGGRLVDSSPMYGAAEQATGTASTEAGINAGLFIATKVWTSGHDRGVTQMRRSLERLKRPRIELMQIHNLVDWKTQLKTLRQWKEKGIFRYIGITHYSVAAFPEIVRILRSEALDFVQVPYSVGETAAGEGGAQSLLSVAAARRVAVIANEPFGQGSLFRHARGRKLPPWCADIGVESWAQYFLKFILGDERVQFVIPATRRLDHLRDNMAAGRGNLPTAEQRARMLADFRNL